MGHVPHLFLPGPWTEPILALDEGHVHHLRRVLRLGDGGPVSYTDGEGTVGEGLLTSAGVQRGEEAVAPRSGAPPVAVAPPASRDRQRFLVEKLAELGVPRLIWLSTRHGEGRPPRADKAAAWARAALEQSRGAWSMQQESAALSDLPAGRLVIADPGGQDSPGVDDPIIVIGPEAGWAADEIPKELPRMRLGPNVLRVETAAIVGATVLAERQRLRGGD